MAGTTANGHQEDPVRGESDGVAGDDAPRLQPVSTSDRWFDLGDQVPRKDAYLVTHPDTGIIPPCSHEPRWQAKLRGGAVEVKALELGLLLDQLEKLD